MKIDKYLGQGEVIDKTFALKGYDVHATNRRLFISSFDGKVVQDFVYDHISSLLFTAKRYNWLLVLGTAIIIVSLFYMNFLSRTPFRLGFDWFWVGIVVGVACIILGIFLKKEVMVLFVIGIPKSPALEGDRKHLEDLFRTIREKKGESAASPSDMEEET
jgi:hypothetical protein